MTKSETSQCSTHGESPATYVCEQLAEDAAQRWHCDYPSQDSPWPDAWCDRCNAELEKQGEWNDANQGALNIQMLCTGCYERRKGESTASMGAASRAQGEALVSACCVEFRRHFKPQDYGTAAFGWYLEAVLFLRKTCVVTLCGASALAVMSNLIGSGIAASSEPTVAAMQWHRRVLIISTPRIGDPDFDNQNRLLAQWRGGDDRDVTVVRIEDVTVTGSRDTAKQLRDHYQLPADSFSAALVGKDGHVALRSRTPLSGAELEGLIDSMPMRKAGQR